MTIKEKIVEQLDGMNEAELAALEQFLRRSRESSRRSFAFLDILAEPMSEEDQAAFKEAMRGS